MRTNTISHSLRPVFPASRSIPGASCTGRRRTGNKALKAGAEEVRETITAQRYNNPMRGVVARGLVLLFSFLLISPCVFVADPQTNLPPCCRKNGRHHCGMAEHAVRSTYGSGLSSIAAKCPLFPRSLSASHPVQFIASRAMQMVIAVERTACVQRHAQFKACSGRAHQERGPPQLSLS